MADAQRSSKKKKTLSARQAPGILKNVALPFRTIEKIRQPREKNSLVDTRPKGYVM